MCGSAGSRRSERPRIWRVEMLAATEVTSTRQFTDGASQPSPSRPRVPTTSASSRRAAAPAPPGPAVHAAQLDQLAGRPQLRRRRAARAQLGLQGGGVGGGAGERGPGDQQRPGDREPLVRGDRRDQATRRRRRARAASPRAALAAARRRRAPPPAGRRRGLELGRERLAGEDRLGGRADEHRSMSRAPRAHPGPRQREAEVRQARRQLVEPAVGSRRRRPRRARAGSAARSRRSARSSPRSPAARGSPPPRRALRERAGPRRAGSAARPAPARAAAAAARRS